MNHQNLPPHRPGEEERETPWTSLATAHDQVVAELWQQVLQEEGIPCMLAPQDAISFMGVASTPVRLLVPAGMKARAEEVLASLSDAPDGGDSLDP